MLGPSPGYRGRGGRRGGNRGNYRPRGNSRGSSYRTSRYQGSGGYGGNHYMQSYRPRGRGGGHRYDSGGSYRRGGYSNYNNSYRNKRNYDNDGRMDSRPNKRKYEPRTAKNFRSAEPQNVSFKLKRLVLGSGDPSSHENDETETRQHNGLFSSFYDMFLLTRVDSHQKTVQINAKRVEGSVFSTTIHPSSVYSINIFTDSLPDESFFEKFEEQLVLEGQLEELDKELEEKEKLLEDLREKSKPAEGSDEEAEQEASAVAEKKLELEIKQKELDVLEVNEKIKKARDRLEVLQAEIFEATQNDAEEDMEEEIKEDEPEKMEVEETEEAAEATEEPEVVEEDDAPPTVDEESLKAMKVAELKEFIKGKGEQPKGNKAALLEMALAIINNTDEDKDEDVEVEEVEVEVAAEEAENEGEGEGEEEQAEEEEDVVEEDEAAEADAEVVEEEEEAPAEGEKEGEKEKAAEGDENDGADAMEEDGDAAAEEETTEKPKEDTTETIDLTEEAEDSGKSLCRVFIGLKEPLAKVRTSLAGCTNAAPKTYCLLLEADLKEGQRFQKVKRFLESFVKNAYDSKQVNMEKWGKRKVSNIASKLLKEAMKRRKLDFEIRECSNGCGEKLRAYELENHEQNDCKNRLIACQYCKTELMHCKMAEHKSVCELCMLRCPNNCGKTIPRKDMQKHIDESCANQKVDCEFAAYGCKIKEKRKNKARHMQERCVAHLNLVRKAHGSLQTKYDKLFEFLKSKYEDMPDMDEPKIDPNVACIVIED